MIAAAVFILRRRRPDLPRPYRTWGYPVVPALFILACLLLIGNTLKESPVESLLGLGLVALGLPAYALFRRRTRLRELRKLRDPTPAYAIGAVRMSPSHGGSRP